MIFDWDEQKEKINVKNHDGVNFDEASAAVLDDFALEEYDDAHSTAEEKRYKCIGEGGNKILYVVYTVRNEETDNGSLSNYFGEISRAGRSEKL